MYISHEPSVLSDLYILMNACLKLLVLGVLCYLLMIYLFFAGDHKIGPG